MEKIPIILLTFGRNLGSFRFLSSVGRRWMMPLWDIQGGWLANAKRKIGQKARQDQ
jgi:hypothetical protein